MACTAPIEEEGDEDGDEKRDATDYTSYDRVDQVSRS